MKSIPFRTCFRLYQTSVAEKVSHLPRGLLGQEHCYSEHLTAFQMK